MQLDGAIARCAFEAQALRAHRVDVRAPAVDRPDFVAGGSEESGVDRPHRSRADDGDFQFTTSNNPAAPMPPPMHIVTTTFFALRRRPSMSAWPTRRAPLMP